MEIKNIYGNVIFEDNFRTIKKTIENAVRQRADLSGADLSGANLSEANLFGANLSGADLSEADLSGANLSEANLFGANLFRADLSGANLFRANLSGANLFRANLFRADLSGANLFRADLSGANLSEADLSEADLSEANIPNFQVCLEEGDFIAFKKLAGGHICKLKIPSEAKRTSNLINRKCRCEFAEVLFVEDKNGNPVNEYYGLYDDSLIYKVGEIVRPDRYCDDIRLDCSNGIHFFITKKEAIEW